MKYLASRGKMEQVMRELESSEDKLNYLAVCHRSWSESDIEEKRRILTKLRDYFENGETFKIPKEREQF